MSGREWKPGDVALVKAAGTESEALALRTSIKWVTAGYGDVPTDLDCFAFRPLVVIDPEDREQVKALVAIYRETDGYGLDRMQAVLRSLITPPRPPEPMGLGAVVEDADGRKWVRVGGDTPWCSWDASDETHTLGHYRDIHNPSEAAS